MSRRKIILLSCFVVAATLLFLLWSKYRFVFNAQPALSNKNYSLTLDSVRMVRKKLYKEKASAQVLEKKFIALMNTKIFPYWYGTKWDFYGTTQKPNEGSIACGYFVTTTLRDVGIPINRTKMAQCASEEMIRSLASKKYIQTFSGMDIKEFEKRLIKSGKGLYVAGLDKHTGFILISSEGNYFIHSTGIFPFQVVKDKLTESPLMVASKYRVTGKISADEGFLKRWVENGQ
ncbi:MAG: hypothetical protein ACJ75J_10645 [Cytophagaceae bacterium]